MGRIKDLAAATVASSDDSFVVDNATDGTRRIDVQTVLPYIYNGSYAYSGSSLTEGFSSLPSGYTVSVSEDSTGKATITITVATASEVTSSASIMLLAPTDAAAKIYGTINTDVARSINGANTEYAVTIEVYDNDGTLTDPTGILMTFFLW